MTAAGRAVEPTANVGPIDPAQLTVVIPTVGRGSVLYRTLDALAAQTVPGFRVVVSVDGVHDLPRPLPPEVQVVHGRAGGSAVTRNRGLGQVATTLALLLDDDMVPYPDLVARHLEAHARHPEETTAVLGRAEWHPEVRRSRLTRWLDWSKMMFPYAELDDAGGTDVGWPRFVSCNVSMKTALVRRVGGFDERFVHYCEDTDLAKRLGDAGLALVYEPAAVTQHLQGVDADSIRRRFDRVAIGERVMVDKHPDFDPWFQPRMARALEAPTPAPWWPWIVDLLPGSPPRLRRGARRRAHRHYLRWLAPSYLAAYGRAEVLCELMDHLGDDYDPMLLVHSEAELEREEADFASERDFYRSSRVYPYDLTAFELTPTKEPYHRLLRRHLPDRGSVLDFGCGIGSDGLALAAAGHRPAFADFDNPAVAFLRERLQRRGLEADVYDIEHDDIPGGFDAVIAYDVIEHVEDPFAFLARLESLGRVVSVNFLEPHPADTHLHHPLPVDALLAHVRSQNLLAYRRFHGRSHVVVYEPAAAGGAPTRVRSWRELLTGRARARVGDLAAGARRAWRRARRRRPER